MYENGDVDYNVNSSTGHQVNPWLRLTLVLGVIVAVVLLVAWGVSAAPSGGCGGG